MADSPPALYPAIGNVPSVWAMPVSAESPAIARYSYRSFDRQHVLADARLLDRPGPPIWTAHGSKQVYITSLLTEVLGHGPAAVATADIPDLHHFRGSFGGKHVVPLWRNPDAAQPNITEGVLETIGAAYGTVVCAERLFAYAYGVLAQPEYVERFWEELELPPPRLPITKDSVLFQRMADHGARLLYLHTYGARFAGPGDDGSVPQGMARCTKTVPFDKYPADSSYDQQKHTLRVGDGEFAPVTPDVWNYSVSGLQVVKSWLDRRKLNRSGRQSSVLD